MKTPRYGALLLLALMPCGAQALTLAEARRSQAEQDPALLAAAIEARGSEGDLMAASRRPPAELSVGTSKLSRQGGIGPGHWGDKRVDSTLGVNWTWERGGKRRLRSSQARQLAQAARLDLLDARRQQDVALVEAYFELKAAQELLQLAEDNRRASSESLRAADRQVAVGAIAPVERARMAVDDLKVADDARVAAQQQLMAQQALALLMGTPETAAALRADDDWPAMRANEAGAMELPARRADLLAAQARVEAADAARALARSLRTRDVQLGVEAEREPRDIQGVTWGVSLTVPLNGPNHYRGERLRAEADYDAALLEQTQLQRQARTDLQRLQLAVQAARAKRAQYETALVPAAQQALDGMELAYRRGSATLTDLLDARRTWRESQAELLSARTDDVVAAASWQAATTPIASDEIP